MKEVTAFNLDKDVIDKLKVLAKRDSRSLSYYVNEVLKRHVNHWRPRKKILGKRGNKK